MTTTHLVVSLSKDLDRSLIKRLGESTLQLHQDVVDSVGFVWWGKFRQGDKSALSPANLQLLQDQIAAGEPTYLYIGAPEGQFQARLTQIEDRNYPTPTSGIPAYYSTTPDLLVDFWLRLDSFTRLYDGHIEANLIYARGRREGEPMDFAGQTAVRLGRLNATTSIPAIVIVTRLRVQQASVETYSVRSTDQATIANRIEANLVERFVKHLAALGRITSRHRYVIGSETTECDIYDETTDLLIEAKASANRDDVRMAIGQLADYGRHEPDATRAVLLPKRPSQDLVDLIWSTGTDVIYEDGPTFATEQRQ